MIKFPKNFLWGAATSAYQVEGGNAHCDWWEWEKRTGLKDSSGEACRHYQLYEEDFDLAKKLNHNAHRLSIEWSRIEPEENRFSDKEIKHYTDVILALKSRDIEPIVTLHHFTNPLWFIESGGWQNKKAPIYFLRYVEKIVHILCDKVRFWVTINEPFVYIYFSYIAGVWPPQMKSFLKAGIVKNNLARCHIEAYRIIHNIYTGKKLPSPFVSFANNMQAFKPCVFKARNRLAVYLRDRIFNFEFINRFIRSNALDFIGINYYTRSLIHLNGWGFKGLLTDTCKNNCYPLKKNSLGWDIYPEGLYKILVRLKKYKLPVFILENGICAKDDELRWDFIRQHLKSIHSAMEEGVDVRGYLYWSLIDNFEWDKGFGPRFGLVEVDYNTYKRTIRNSAIKLALVCKTGILE